MKTNTSALKNSASNNYIETCWTSRSVTIRSNDRKKSSNSNIPFLMEGMPINAIACNTIPMRISTFRLWGISSPTEMLIGSLANRLFLGPLQKKIRLKFTWITARKSSGTWGIWRTRNASGKAQQCNLNKYTRRSLRSKEIRATRSSITPNPTIFRARAVPTIKIQALILHPSPSNKPQPESTRFKTLEQAMTNIRKTISAPKGLGTRECWRRSFILHKMK